MSHGWAGTPLASPSWEALDDNDAATSPVRPGLIIALWIGPRVLLRDV
jgi:hypothetical protein